MTEPRIDDIENLVTEIIDKVTLRAMEIVDSSSENIEAASHRLSSNCANSGCRKCSEPKIRNRSLRPARRSNERMKKKCFCDAEGQGDSRALEKNVLNDVNQRASEEIRKIVYGLQSVQIGDSTLVKPVERISNLERQVKLAVADIQSGACEIPETNVVPVTDGQGDAQIFRENLATTSAVVEVEYDPERVTPPIEIVKLESVFEKENGERQIHAPRQIGQRLEPEISKLRSTCFLHRMIKELEDANDENFMGGSSNSISAISQERIAAWEESEEKFIRTIEGTRDESQVEISESRVIIEEDSYFGICPVKQDASAAALNETRIIDGKMENLDSKPVSTPLPMPPPFPPPLSPNACRTETMKTSILPCDTTLERFKTKSKKSVGEKLRKFFLSAFKRAKD